MKHLERETEWGLWMRAAISGDEKAYSRFLVAVTPHLRAMARRRCEQFGAPVSEAEDVVQEVLITIHLKRGTWDTGRPIGPWISTIVRNKLIDSLRRRGHRVNVPIEDVIDVLQAEEQPGGLDMLDVDRLLDELKEPQRDIVRSISLNGANVRETAERLQMTEGSVRVSLHRALKSLAALYRSKSG
ncbi:sigma-70 family RNA polymerase sigma factor [Pararhizobium sp.]|uniref:sigma-70 family RNA polymerase sigma factor n=1 Tax=Pararhizobium sp. TaxID=1977563 RepID=UPI00271A398F|nr:sigma-70 family RNA polymerase sigma factor [Pararhizobium sp.]MDO9416707.1 sigma-70 family RNA polymerase sigma factor [Pararhizobium sp.]